MVGVLIDAHHHLWDVSKGYAWLDDPALAPLRRSFSVTDLRAELSANGVDYTILVEAGRCAPAEVEEFLNIAGGTPEIAAVVGWCDVTSPRLPSSPSLVGARDQIQGQPDPDFLARQDVHSGLRTLAERGLVFDLVIRPDQLPAAAAAARAIPELTFVLDHLGKPPLRSGDLGPWRSALERLALQPNVYAKLSGLVTEAAWDSWTVADLVPPVDAALELFGADRLMFGSDWPVCLLAASYSDVKASVDETLAQLSAAEREQIFSGTAIRAYGLSGLLGAAGSP